MHHFGAPFAGPDPVPPCRTGKRAPPSGDGWQFRAGKRYDDAVMDDFKRSTWMLRYDVV